MIDAGVIASEGAYADDGYVNDAASSQVVSSRGRNYRTINLITSLRANRRKPMDTGIMTNFFAR